MATPPTPTPPPTLQSKVLGILYTLGIGAAAIFVKNPNHQQTANEIITVLQTILPELESLI